ncbi:XRE family transcriptional regulator [Helicobacter rodentium]|uniref:XRE family transcriptional regulator n=1 Tax=Helicobacter rodentium TaxID=59617 RepID=UPI0023EFA8AC|nr:helix-turn-helix domain-containing protein [Helicobacter rodentium]
MKLGNKIKAAREAKQLTQNELVKISGISRASLQLYEADKGNITLDNLEKIADALNVDIAFFVSPNDVSYLSPSDVSKSIKSVSYLSPSETFPSETSQIPPQTLNQDDFYFIPKLNITASAGGGNELEGLECYESGQTLAIDKAFFKAIPSRNIKAIRVDGYSMIPLLFPDSWVIFEEGNEFKGDGLYIINYANQLMVKLLQLNPITNILEIISTNKDYKSYEVSLSESQELCLIRGKVLRSII